MQDVATAFELVARDPHIGEENRKRPQHPRGLVVARLQQIRQRELRELPCPRRNEIDQQQVHEIWEPEKERPGGAACTPSGSV